jgi:molybdopterin-guanine dinucleotide biosynthesis protein A
LRSPRQVLLAQSCALLDLDDTDPRLTNLNDPALLRQTLPDGT